MKKAKQYRPRTTTARTTKPVRASREERGYTHRWRKASKQFLNEHPTCAGCARQGRVRAATVVDHVTPHKGCQELFWSQDNWQPLCVFCHNSKSARE